jgi:hypothetical protein
VSHLEHAKFATILYLYFVFFKLLHLVTPRSSGAMGRSPPHGFVMTRGLRGVSISKRRIPATKDGRKLAGRGGSDRADGSFSVDYGTLWGARDSTPVRLEPGAPTALAAEAYNIKGGGLDPLHAHWRGRSLAAVLHQHRQRGERHQRVAKAGTKHYRCNALLTRYSFGFTYGREDRAAQEAHCRYP